VTHRAACMMAVCGAALLTATVMPSAVAAPSAALGFVDRTPAAPGTRVVDVRAETACEHASLPGARCLPAADLFDARGRPVSFHTLRWLFGTIGLSGQEHVLVAGADAGNAAAVGALLYLAGQRTVAVLDRPLTVPAKAEGGRTRNITREVVFTAPMRDRLMVAAPEQAGGETIASGPPAARLCRFATRSADGAQPPPLRLWP
jgi:3-mercaptopyruvate sulfurtransferase SseA